MYLWAHLWITAKRYYFRKFKVRDAGAPPSVMGIPFRLAGMYSLPTNDWDLSCDLRVAQPGIVQSFDSAKQTAVVKLVTREKIIKQGVTVDEEISPLLDVPICIPRAGGFSLLLPVQAGDECLVIFTDMCYDAWFQSSGVQNQLNRRRHDLSNAIAILGCWSQPRVLPSYPTASAQLRNDTGTCIVEVTPDHVNVTAPTVNVAGSTAVNITGGHTTIDGKNFLNHIHTDPQGGNTGIVV